MKVKVRKNIIVGALLLLAALLICCVGVLCATPTTAHAASNNSIQTIYASETHTHKVSSSLNAKEKPTDFTQYMTRDTGIKIYATTNNGNSVYTSSLKSDSSTICVDFANANKLYLPTGARSNYYDKTYSFEILSGSSVKWYATYTGTSYSEVTGKDENGNDVSTTFYKKVLNINGRSNTTVDTNSSLRHFSPSDFGAHILSLNDGSYNIRIKRSYHWSKTVDGKFLGTGYAYYNAESSLSATLLIDTASPTLSMTGYSGGKTIANGSYSNERVTFRGSDTNFTKLYYKTPGSSGYSYTSSNSYTSGTANGWYSAYIEDAVGHKSPEYSFYYDNVAPTGKIYSNGIAVNSGAYISKAFSYAATDSGSGVAAIYYKTPVSGVYQQYASGTVIPANAGDGWYYFYSEDKAGSRSATMSVYLETQAPLVEIYRNNELAYSKSMTSVGTYDTDIYFNPNDSLKISCDTSSGKMTSNYALDTNITIGSSYTGGVYTITLTSATGITSNFNFHVVHSKPVISIGGRTYSSGSTLYFNTDQDVSFNDDPVIQRSENTGATIASEGNVNINEHIAYSSNTGKTLTTEAGTETKYVLTLDDRAGNESRFTVFIDKKMPEGVWKSDGKTVPDNGYTNKPLAFYLTEAGVTATYSHNGGEYSAYTNGTSLTEDGSYHVVLTDLAGNKRTYIAHIDTVAPVGQLYADNKPVQSGSITNKSVFFSWDGNITATVNGAPYAKNSVLSEDNVYRFVLTDLAGNQTEYAVTIDTEAPAYNSSKLNDATQFISKWYLAHIDGADYSFATYEEALAFACDKEFGKSVTVLTLDNVADFKHHHLVADGGEVRTGTYWLYKSKANPDSMLYYFDRETLDGVIAYYAKNHVSAVNYFRTDEENVYGTAADSMSDNALTAPDGTVAPVLNDFVFDCVDGCELYAELLGGSGERIRLEYGIPFKEQISVGGLYKITEIDAANNVSEFYGFMDVLSPDLHVQATIIGNGEPTELTISRDNLANGEAFYYQSFQVNAIADADKWAVLAVENNGVANYYTYGDVLPCLTVGGEYVLSVYDRFGNGYSFTVYIIGNPANITFDNNGDDTAFDIVVTLEQKFDTLVSLEIKRNGALLSNVSTDKLSYTFDKAGTYSVSLRDNFGRLITKEYVFRKALPEGELQGVAIGGKTKTDVSFVYDNTKFYATVAKDGQAFAEDDSGVLGITATAESSGKYVIRLTRITDVENYTEYPFIINTLAPDFDMSVADRSTTNQNVTVTWSQEDIVKVMYSLKGREISELKNGSVLSEEGTYTVTAINDLGTQCVKTFTIDKTLEYDVLVNDTETIGLDMTNKNVTVINHEPLYVSVTKENEPFEFAFGQVLSAEGLYSFRVYDDYGNTASFTVIIDKTVDISSTVGNGVISNEDVVISASEKVNVILTKDGEEYAYTLGTPLHEEGLYRLTAYDMNGNEKTLSFRIVKGTKSKLDYVLGENVLVQSVTRDGEIVSTENNRLNFDIDGTYTVVCSADGKEYSFALTLDGTAPTVELNGVKNGGTSGKSVSIVNLSENGTVAVYKDGEFVEYELGEELTEYGSYRVVVTDAVGNTNEYAFTLEHQTSGGVIALIVIAGIAAIGGGVFAFLFVRKRKRH